MLGYERAAGRREAFLCEGVFDYLTAVGWGLPAFSPCGTALPADRLGFLAGARAVYGVLDGDEAGRAARGALRRPAGPALPPLRLPDGCDLNDLARRPDGRARFFRLLAAARPPRAAELPRAPRRPPAWPPGAAAARTSGPRARPEAGRAGPRAVPAPPARGPGSAAPPDGPAAGGRPVLPGRRRAGAWPVRPTASASPDGARRAGRGRHPRTNAAIVTPAENFLAAVSLPEPFGLELAAAPRRAGSSSAPAGPAMRRHLEAQLARRLPPGGAAPAWTRGRVPGPRPGRRGARTSRWPPASWSCAAPAYLPLRTFRDAEVDAARDAQADPVLGLLGALDDLPEGWRALAQLVLRPAPAGWCRDYLRLAVEHPLAGERRRRARPGTGALPDRRASPWPASWRWAGGPAGATRGTPPASGSPLALLAAAVAAGAVPGLVLGAGGAWPA